MNVRFEKYIENRDADVSRLLSKTNFMDSNVSPRDSIIQSIFEYQNVTDPNRVFRGVAMKNDAGEIVGYMGAIFQPCSYKGKDYDMYQTSSAFIDPNYRGNLSNIFRQFVGNVPANSLTTSIGASLVSVIKSTEKVGFVQVNKSRFDTQYVLPIRSKAFINEYLAKKWMRALAILFIPLISIYYRNRSKAKYDVKIMDNFDNDYSNIGDCYNKRNYDKLVVKWNAEILQQKFGKRLSTDMNHLRENEVVQLCACDCQNNIVGTMVISKVREFNKIMLIDIQTIDEEREEIVYSLIRKVQDSGYASFLIYGIEECYMEIINRRFHLLKKHKDWRIYYMPSHLLPTEDVSFVYSDDDVNY